MDGFVWAIHGHRVNRSTSLFLMPLTIASSFYSSSLLKMYSLFQEHWIEVIMRPVFNSNQNKTHLPVPQLWEASERVGDVNCLLGADDEEP